MALGSPKVRSDLKYQADPEAEGRYFVKDPIRHEFFRYNELQVAMMRALDGKRTLAEVQQHLADEYEAQVPVEAIGRFVDRLERALLLDVASYRVDDAKTRNAILNALRKQHLALRVKARAGTASPEADLFEASVRQLNEGDPCLAASYLDAVLEINPNNERARKILLCIHQAFFKTKIVVPSHVKMHHLWSPDRFLAAVDRKIGRFVFSTVGVVLLLAFMISSVVSAIDVLSRPDLFGELSWLDIPLVLFVFALHAAVHELSHGLACKHHGGVVDDVGLLLMYGVIPGAYCDVSESYLFARRRQKIEVQIAGVFGHMVLQAAAWHVLYLTDPTFPLWGPLLAINLYMMYSNFKNLIPLAKFDGYYALAELLNIPNLRERSFGYLRDRLAARTLGLPSQAGNVTPAERRVFLAYGISACVFTALMMYFLFISFLLPKAVGAFGTVGLVFAVGYIAQQVVLKVGVAVVRVLILVVRQRKQIFTVRRTFAFAAVAGVLVVVLSLPWPLHVEGAVLLEPQGRFKVRATEPGVVEEIRVHEGDVVAAGQVLAVLRCDQLVRDRAVAAQELEAARAHLAILHRGARDEELAVASADTQVERVAYRAASGRASQARKASAIGSVSRNEAFASAALASEAGGTMVVSARQQAVVRAGARTEDIAAEEADVRRREVMLQALDVRLAKLEIRSPIAGVVVTARTEEQRGRWLALGDELVEVHDMSRWRFRIIPDRGESLDALAAGQDVDIRPWGEPEQLVSAQIETIAPPETNDAPLVLYAIGANATWRSGMTGTAQIYIPSRSIAYRLIALPVIRLFDYDLWRIR